MIIGEIRKNTPYVKCNFGGEKIEEEEFVVDTGYSGGILVRPDRVKKYELKGKGPVKIVVADGKETDSIWYEGWIEWFGRYERIDVDILDNCPNFLLGMGLLNDTTIKLQGAKLEIVKNIYRGEEEI